MCIFQLKIIDMKNTEIQFLESKIDSMKNCQNCKHRLTEYGLNCKLFTRESGRICCRDGAFKFNMENTKDFWEMA